MMKRNRTISLGRLFGIPLELDLSWFLIFALLTWTLAVSYFPNEFGDWPRAEYWIIGAITSVMLFVSVMLHELGHSVIAQRYRVAVRRITLFIFGGVSEITSEPPSAAAEFWIALAGPVVSFALAGVFALLEPAVGGSEPLLALAKYLAYINATVAAFNLIPGFPLDGGRVLRAILWGITHNLRRATTVAANVGRIIAFGFILFGVWQAFSGNVAGGLWIAFIGWFLEGAALSQVQQQRVTQVLDGHRVNEAMTTQYATVPPSENLDELVHEKILGTGGRTFLVQSNSHPEGLLTLHEVREVPREKWSTTSVQDRMIPLANLDTVGPSEDLVEAIKKMDSDGVNQLPVVADEHVIGVLSRESIISYLRNLQDLGL
jgi:Zn-dependent protease/CBS domain-containing protein